MSLMLTEIEEQPAALERTLHREWGKAQRFRAQAATVAVGVRASIERAIDENASTVIDGVALFPGALDLALYRDRADVIFLVVAALDREAWAARFSAREAGSSQRPAHEYLANLDKILRIQDQFLEAAD